MGLKPSASASAPVYFLGDAPVYFLGEPVYFLGEID